MFNIMTILLASATMLILALFMGYILGWANLKFHVDIDPKIEQVNEALPGANCGGCGYVGCMEYAEAVVSGKAAPNQCPVGGENCASSLAEIMGIVLDEAVPSRAVIHCFADNTNRLKIQEYRGESTCATAHLVPYVQECVYGCLGLGDCKVSCKYDAIKITNDLALIDYDRCIGCGACIKACPRNIIEMVSFKKDQIAVVACSNQDSAKDVRSACNSGCVGCKACNRITEFYVMDKNLAKLDYENYNPDYDYDPAVKKCPRKCIIYIGKSTSALKNEYTPENAAAETVTPV